MKKISVNIITGFLGAGKTTVISNLLKKKTETEQWAVIINEFGKISIDFTTLSPLASSIENVLEISGGCICYSAEGYFRQNLEKIVELKKFDRIIIEPSGLGGIDTVAEIVKSNSGLQLMAVICLAEINFIDIPRFQNLPIYRSQLMKSDILIVSKCDLEPDKKRVKNIIDKFKSEFPNKLKYLASNDGELNNSLLKVKKTVNKTLNFINYFFLSKEHTDENYNNISFSFQPTAIFNIDELLIYFGKESGIIRAKGYIHMKEGWSFINYSPNDYTIQRCKAQNENQLTIIFQVRVNKVKQFNSIYLKLMKSIVYLQYPEKFII